MNLSQLQMRIKFILYKTWTTYRRQGFIGVWTRVKIHCVVLLNNIMKKNVRYEDFIKYTRLDEKARVKIRSEIDNLPYKPTISIIIPVYNVEEVWLRKCLESVMNQIYPCWEACIADDASAMPHVKNVLEEFSSKDRRIKVVYRSANGHISQASNSALQLAIGDYIALLDHDDELAEVALYENVLLINKYPKADMIYSDEDKIDVDGNRTTPFFKPDWSPDTFLSQMYTCHLGVYRTELVRSVGGFREGFEGSQDYDLVLRLTEKTKNIYHIPKILYHWRILPQSTAYCADSKDYTHLAGRKALQEAIKRREEPGWIEDVKGVNNLYRVHYYLRLKPLISILIPTRDLAEILDRCLESIFTKSTYKNFEVLVLDNGSRENKTFEVFDEWRKNESDRFKTIRIDAPFNYSKINNIGVCAAQGEFILFLNNDIEVLTTSWLEEMLSQAVRSSIGAVGARLLYPDKSIQHSGVILGIGGVAGHGHKGCSRYDFGYFGALAKNMNYSAVTGACLMVRKKLFEQIGGFDEELAVAFNDVDFCLKLIQLGLYNIVLPHVQLVHYESKSRGYEDTLEKMERFCKESEQMKLRWGNILENDPFYNPNLTLKREDFSLRDIAQNQNNIS